MEIPQCVLEEFNNKYIINSSNGCWEWISSLQTGGYGLFVRKYFKENFGTTSAHRISYLIHKGDFERSLLIRHICNNRKCVNPDHLVTGNSTDNTRDKLKRFYSENSKDLHDILRNYDITRKTISEALQVSVHTVDSWLAPETAAMKRYMPDRMHMLLHYKLPGILNKR